MEVNHVIRRLILPLLPLAAVLATAAPAQAGSCSLSMSEQRNGLGATYTTSLRVTKTTCAKGKQVVKAFNSCRKANGGADGRCTRKVKKFSCSEKRTNQIDTQYDSTTTCKRGGKKVVFTYTQFT
jgi:hypothetical protein